MDLINARVVLISDAKNVMITQKIVVMHYLSYRNPIIYNLYINVLIWYSFFQKHAKTQIWMGPYVIVKTHIISME